MPVLVPSKLKQMGMDKAYKIVDAVDVELTGGSDVQTFVDNFASTLADYVTVKDGDFGTQGQYAISNADGTISFTSSSSAVDPDLITEDGVKFRFGRNSVGEFGYIITTEGGMTNSSLLRKETVAKVMLLSSPYSMLNGNLIHLVGTLYLLMLGTKK